MSKFIITITLFFFQISFLSAQLVKFNPAEDRYWLNSGYGLSSIGGYGFHVSASYQAKPHLATIRVINHFEINKNVALVIDPMERVLEVGFMYGRSFHAPAGLVSFSGGLGIVTGQKRGDLIYFDQNFWPLTYEGYETKQFTTIGIPLEASIFFTPIPRTGVGITAFANINFRKPLVGIALSAAVGKLN